MKRILTAFMAVFLCLNIAHAAQLSPQGPFRALDGNADPCTGCKLYTYEAGTSTPKDTFTDESGDTANANPVILDSDGYADVWLGDGAYKYILKDSNDATIWTLDDISGTAANAFGDQVVSLAVNTTITTAYENNLILTTASPTLSLLGAAAASEGFTFAVKNNDTGSTTIDPNGSETIDGSLTYTLNEDEWAIIYSDGTNWEVTATKFQATSITDGSAGQIIYHSSSGAGAWGVFTDFTQDTIARDSEILFQSADGLIKYASAANLIGLTGLQSVQKFSSPGDTTWTRPDGVNTVLAIVVGGGGGGGGADASGATAESAAGGGGGGGGCIDFIDVSAISSGQVTVGAAGAAGAGSTGATGGTGGTSGFIGFSSATGGIGGNGTGNAAGADLEVGGAGGAGTGCDFPFTGGAGGPSAADVAQNNAVGGAGGNSFVGGGGTSAMAQDGSNSVAAGAGGDFGGGGGGGADVSASGSNGGAGGGGAVFVLEFAN